MTHLLDDRVNLSFLQLSIGWYDPGEHVLVASDPTSMMEDTMNYLKQPVIWALAVLMVASIAHAADSKSELQIKESADGFLFSEGSSKVLFYQRKPKSMDGKFERANYVHPLYDFDGNILTEDFPDDHRHHRGIFWAWHQVTIGDKKIGDPWLIDDFSWDVHSAKIVPTNSKQISLKVDVLWKSPKWTDDTGKPKPLVKEMTVIRVHKSEAGIRRIDFQISLLALESNLRIGGSDDPKGYGGFSPRFRLPKDIRFLGRNGIIEPQRLSVDAGPWMDLSGSFGKPNQLSGITILCHPSVPGFPQRWILRKSRSMQNPVYPGREPVLLSAKTPLVFRYRIVIHRGTSNPKQIEKWQKEYGDSN